MRNFLIALWSHIFIVLAGLAALPHSIYSVSVIMQGAEPPFPSLYWIGWAFSGLLLGLTIDVGQIVISIQIARGDGTKMRLFAFCLLAVFIWYLQWYYSATHVALTSFALGMSSQSTSFTLGLRDLGVWIVPALLPITTMIYTFGYPSASKKQPTATITQTQTTVKVERPIPKQLSSDLPRLESSIVSVQCPDCGYTVNKTTLARANSALRMHRRAKHQKVEVDQ